MTISSRKSRRSLPPGHGPAGFRCLISSLAAALQVVIFAGLNFWDWSPQRNLLLWCWVIALDLGITFAIYGFCSARNWNERILAACSLCFQILSLWILFLIGVGTYANNHGTGYIH